MFLVKKDYETDLHDFQAWSGGKDTLYDLTLGQLDQLSEIISEMYINGIEETHLNDFLWHERDYIAKLLGFSDYDELLNENRKENLKDFDF